jgi:7,8-dihydropterin-6-yl-methyl-4-(beta-D-ribofuranosyl)aminobenzene 5'-phosphate synthase
MKRRDFLKASAAFAGAAAGGFSCVEFAGAAPIEAPVVDKLNVRVVVDLTHNIFLRPSTFKGMTVTPAPRAKDYTRELHTQWGLSYYLESVKGGETKRLMLDYAYTPDALLNNIELIGVEPAKLDALIVSPGHFDHYGGLIGFLDKYRSLLPADVKLYAGGEDNFCHRVQPTGTPGEFSDFGYLDRNALAARNVGIVLCENPTVIAGHAFTTGQIKRETDEKILPQTFEQFGKTADGLGCDASHYTPAELLGKTVPDEHYHEHATVLTSRIAGSSCYRRAVIAASSTRPSRRWRFRASPSCMPCSAASTLARRRWITPNTSSASSSSSIPISWCRCIAAARISSRRCATSPPTGCSSARPGHN